jgi:hypothetical protein
MNMFLFLITCYHSRRAQQPCRKVRYSILSNTVPTAGPSSRIRMCGAGAFFSIFTTILVYMDYRFGGTKQNSEQVRLLQGCVHTISSLPSRSGIYHPYDSCMFQNANV